MGKLEVVFKKKLYHGRVQQALLASIAVPGILAIAVMAPNVLQVLGSFSGDKYKFKYRLKSIASRLTQKGLVRFVVVDGKKCIEITEAGRQVLEDGVSLKKKKQRWDKRWRMVMFDIPERRRKVRDTLRATLEGHGFIRLQDSAWVYPYDCEDFIALLKTDLQSGDTILYLIVETIENDSHLKEHFGL